MKPSASFLFAARLLFPRTAKKSNARRSLLGAMLCIGISLVPLVVVMTVANGMIEGITGRIIGLSSSDLRCILYPAAAEAKNAETLSALSARLRKLDTVKSAYAEIQGVALAAGKNGRTGATVRAVEQTIFSDNHSFRELFTVQSGVPDLSRPHTAVIGAKLAETLGLQSGDVFRLITTQQLSSGRIMPRIVPFRVSAVVSCGYQELDALWIFIPLSDGFSVLPVSTAEVSIGIESPDTFGSGLARTQQQVESAVPDYTQVYRWNELNSAQYENFSSTRMMLLVIMLLIVLVASVNVSSALIMLVMERRKEIAILKSLGGSSSGIALSFLITGFVTGLFGVLAGLPLGLLCAVNFNTIILFTEKTINIFAKFMYLLQGGSVHSFAQIHLLDPAYYLQNVSVVIPVGQLIIICCGTLILSLVVSLIPAVRAGREKPIDTLRKV
jgi:lipoprotein-releasing system permease protein